MYDKRSAQTSPKGIKKVSSVINQKKQSSADYRDQAVVNPNKVRYEWNKSVKICQQFVLVGYDILDEKVSAQDKYRQKRQILSFSTVRHSLLQLKKMDVLLKCVNFFAHPVINMHFLH